MTGKTSTDLSSVLPLGAHSARIAADGGLIVSLQVSPASGNEATGEYHAAGFEPDSLDFIAPQASESRLATVISVPGHSVRPEPVLNSNPI